MNLREQVESDLNDSLEGDWGLPVELISPDGVKQSTKKGNPQSLLKGQILYDTQSQDLETGEDILVHQPVVTLRRSSLDRVPLSGERWVVKIPLTSSLTAPLVTFLLERPSEDGSSIGFIRLYLTKAKQSI